MCSIISFDEVMTTVRDQLDLIAVEIMNPILNSGASASDDSTSITIPVARTILSISVVPP